MKVWHFDGLAYVLPEPKKEVMKIDVEYAGHCFQFFRDGEDDSGPALPLKHGGTYDSMGWDIPNYWAIDANDQPWLDSSGHGFGLHRATLNDILRSMELESRGSSYELRKALGMKSLLPGWMATALRSGWTPPLDFDRNEYE